MARKAAKRAKAKNPTTQMVGEDQLTTMIVGEEHHGISTLLAGEETVFTTLIVGEEGTTHLLGEEGGGIHTTPLLGEEGGKPPTTLAIGEEGGPSTQMVGEEGPTTKRLGEETTQIAGEHHPSAKKRAAKRKSAAKK